MSFSLNVESNEEGWGPATVPDKFKDVPYYTPFNKGDKLGKSADWQQQSYQSKTGRFQKEGATVSTIFNWYYQDDEASFQLVDSTKAQTKRSFTGRHRFQNRGAFKPNQQTRQTNQQQKGRQQLQQQKGQRFKFQNYPNRRWGAQDGGIRKRESSIPIQPSWKLLETVDFSTLSKEILKDEPPAEDLMSCGFLEYYNPESDKTLSKNEKPLQRTERTFFNVTTSDDPIIRQLSSDNRGTIFATDNILAHLMVCTRSIYPWDIIVHKTGSKIFFDKSSSQFDFITVNENALEPPTEEKEDINSMSSLSREATFINQNFSQQVLIKGETYKFPSPNPFQSEGEQVAAVGYKYKKWDLGEDMQLICRCEVDAIIKGKTKDSFTTIKALN